MTKKWQCEKCGCRRKPKHGGRTFKHPHGGTTVLGRRIDMSAIVHYSECPQCGDLRTDGLGASRRSRC